MILLIDDCDDIREIYKTILGFEGLEVISATDGQDGFQKYQSKAPDLILTDLIMPKMSGIKMIEKIRQKNRNIPIIVMSGDPSQGRLSTRMGANLFLEKPFCSKILVENIKSQIQSSNS